MMQGLYIGASGMKTHGEGMQIVSNNLANVSTIGYKQQLLLFEDLMYQDLSLGNQQIVQSQKGLGSVLGDVRTLHTEGPFEPGNAATDLAISGKGFFQVRDGDGEYYTRAGNFRFDATGVLRNPQGMAVSGIKIVNGQEVGGLTDVAFNFNDANTAFDPPKASASLTALMNLNVTNDKISDAASPYFSLLGAWNGAQKPPIAKTDYSQGLKVFDADGVQHTLTVHFDAAPSANGQKVLEYVVTMPPEEDGRPGMAGTPGAGLLMSGTLTFSSSGELINMSAFTPGGGDMKDLNNWTPAPLAGGVPQFTATFAGQNPQALSLNMGVSGAGWDKATASAAAVGTPQYNLPGMASPQFSSTQTTSLPVSSSLKNYSQDGYARGELSDMYVDAEGKVVASYNNGQTHDVFLIPVFRFTSEDGLRREGGNLYSATRESGKTEYGRAGTENYGSIQSNFIEGSNVDMAKEMTSMIIVQRGFQSNSKSITTLDTMIQKAIELKRV